MKLLRDDREKRPLELSGDWEIAIVRLSTGDYVLADDDGVDLKIAVIEYKSSVKDLVDSLCLKKNADRLKLEGERAQEYKYRIFALAPTITQTRVGHKFSRAPGWVAVRRAILFGFYYNFQIIWGATASKVEAYLKAIIEKEKL